MKVFKWIDSTVEKISTYGLVVSVVLMLFFSCFAIVLRWFDMTYLWLDPFVRHLVFLATFLGGALATGKGTHIGIDILGKYLENHRKFFWLNQIHRIVAAVSLITVVWLMLVTLDFTKTEFEYGRNVFWGIHSGFMVAIIPFGFSLIGYRFFYKFISSFGRRKKPERVHG